MEILGAFGDKCWVSCLKSGKEVIVVTCTYLLVLNTVALHMFKEVSSVAEPTLFAVSISCEDLICCAYLHTPEKALSFTSMEIQ